MGLSRSIEEDPTVWPREKKYYAYDDKNRLGGGKYTDVYKAKRKHTGEDCALKFVRRNPKKPGILKAEIEAFRRFTAEPHDNVIKYHQLREDNSGEQIMIVTELMDYSLDRKNGVAMIGKLVVATILRQILEGLRYLHENKPDKIIHRDVKPQNILLNRDGTVKLCDFGIMGIMNDKEKRKTATGTAPFVAPEVLSAPPETGYDEKVDIWSFGCVMMRLVTGITQNADLEACSINVVGEKLKYRKPPVLSPCEYAPYGEELNDVVVCCMQKDPKNRKSARCLLEMPFFKDNYDKNELKEWLNKLFPNQKLMR